MVQRVVVKSEFHWALQPVVVPLIRLGSRHDGGYATPLDALGDGTAVISLGMKDDWSFEQAVRDRYSNVITHSYDPTVSIRKLVDSLWIGLKMLLRGRDLTIWGRSKVLVSYLRYFRGREQVHFKKWVRQDSNSVDSVSVFEVLAQVEGSERIVLKIDIEGEEYGVITDLLDVDPRIRSRISTLLVEFHKLDVEWDRFLRLQERLLKEFALVHVHANNINRMRNAEGVPIVLELTYLRDDLAVFSHYRNRLPIPEVDYPNDGTREDYEIIYAES